MQGIRTDWLDLPRLTSLTAEGYWTKTFRYVRYIILESDSHPLEMMIRHAQSHRRVSSKCVQLQERRHHPWKCALYPSFTHRHWRFSQTFQLSYLFHTRRASEEAQNNENDPAPFKSLGCAQMIGNDDSTPITRSTLFTAHRRSRCDSPKTNHKPTPNPTPLP